MSREGELAKNTLVLSLGTFLPKAASIVVLPILTGSLTQEEYGTYDLITILVSLFLPALTLQIQTGAFRFLIGERKNMERAKEIISSVFCFVTVVAVIGLTLFYALYKTDSWLIKLLVCFYYLSDVWMNSALQCTRGLGKNMYYSIASIANAATQLILAVVFVLVLNGGLLGAVAMLLVAANVSVLYIVFGSGLIGYISPQAATVSATKELLAYSWPMVPNSMSMWAMRSINRIVIISYLGAAANAMFAVAYKIPQIVIIAQGTFTMAWQENASLASEDEDSGAYYTKMFQVIFNMMAGITALLIAMAPVLFAILIRGNYSEAYSYVPILFMAVFFSTISGFLGGIYVALMKTLNVGITTVVSAALNAFLCWVGIPLIGLSAASYAMVASYVFLVAYRMINVRKFVSIEYDLAKCVIITMVLIGLCFLCSVQALWSNILCTVFAVTFACILNKDILNKMLKVTKRFISKGKKSSDRGENK